MRSLLKLTALPLCLFLALGVLDAKNEEKKSSTAKEEKGSSKKKQKKDEKKDAAASTKRADMVPIAKGHDSKGLRIPYYDDRGKLQMTFNIGVASRIDDDHVEMSELEVETYSPTGASEMKIALPKSVLDLNTRVITAKTHVFVQRSDFELTGESMEFNTQTNRGNSAAASACLSMTSRMKHLTKRRPHLVNKLTPFFFSVAFCLSPVCCAGGGKAAVARGAAKNDRRLR
jgi:hypothetical protein